jgi:SAM-dependent methyltransferase
MTTQHFDKTYSTNAAQNYEDYFVPVIGAPLATVLLGAAALSPGERVLDLACGTGVVARLASAAVGPTGTVAGADVNPAMLAVAGSTESPGTIEWHEAPADALPFADDSFDVVLCSLGLMFFPDKPAALREIRRVLAPSGRVAILVPGPTPQAFAAFGDTLARHIDPSLRGFVHHVFSLHDATEIEGLLDEVGFRGAVVKSDARSLKLTAPEDFLWQYVHSTPLSAPVLQADNRNRSALEHDILEAWQPFVEDGVLTIEQGYTVATAEN